MDHQKCDKQFIFPGAVPGSALKLAKDNIPQNHHQPSINTSISRLNFGVWVSCWHLLNVHRNQFVFDQLAVPCELYIALCVMMKKTYFNVMLHLLFAMSHVYTLSNTLFHKWGGECVSQTDLWSAFFKEAFVSVPETRDHANWMGLAY